jgi:hypothetical protein
MEHYPFVKTNTHAQREEEEEKEEPYTCWKILDAHTQ